MAELNASASEYEIVIEPSGGWWNLRWREFWEYRDLLILMVQRDFISRYKQTILGPVWFILQPLLNTVIFTIFGGVAGIPTDGVPAPLFYLCGQLGWNYFAQNVMTGGATFINNSHLFGKVWFPRLIVPVSIVLSNLVSFALQLVPFLAFYMYYCLTGRAGAVTATWWTLLTPLPLVQIALLSLGVSLWISASTAKYRDLAQVTQYLVQLWMFATPVIYPLSKLSEKWAWLGWVNPMAVPVEAFRLCLLGRGQIEAGPLLVSALFTVGIVVSGLAVFQRVQRTVVDSV